MPLLPRFQLVWWRPWSGGPASSALWRCAGRDGALSTRPPPAPPDGGAPARTSVAGEAEELQGGSPWFELLTKEDEVENISKINASISSFYLLLYIKCNRPVSTKTLNQSIWTTYLFYCWRVEAQLPGSQWDHWRNLFSPPWLEHSWCTPPRTPPETKTESENKGKLQIVTSFYFILFYLWHIWFWFWSQKRLKSAKSTAICWDVKTITFESKFKPYLWVQVLMRDATGGEE